MYIRNKDGAFLFLKVKETNKKGNKLVFSPIRMTKLKANFNCIFTIKFVTFGDNLF